MRINSVLDYYSGSFKPVYEEVCGDASTYYLLQDEFDYYLLHNSMQNMSGTTHRGILLRNAPFAEAARVFREFLASGGHCHAQSTAGQAENLARQFKMHTGPSHIRNYDPEAHPQAFYRLWFDSFLPLYTSAIEQIERAAQKKPGHVIPDESSIYAMWQAANRSEILIRPIEKQLNSTMPSELTASLEWAMISAHRAKINNFRNLVVALRFSTRPFSRDRTYIVENIETFIGALKNLYNPFDWVDKVVVDYLNITKANVTVKKPDDLLPLRSDTPTAVWEIMDYASKLAVQAALHRGSEVELKFSWDEKNQWLVISFPVAKPPINVNDRIGELIRRVNGQLAVFVGTHDGLETPAAEIRIPMSVVGPTAPPTGNEGPVDGHLASGPAPASPPPSFGHDTAGTSISGFLGEEMQSGASIEYALGVSPYTHVYQTVPPALWNWNAGMGQLNSIMTVPMLPPAFGPQTAINPVFRGI